MYLRDGLDRCENSRLDGDLISGPLRNLVRGLIKSGDISSLPMYMRSGLGQEQLYRYMFVHTRAVHKETELF